METTTTRAARAREKITHNRRWVEGAFDLGGPKQLTQNRFDRKDMCEFAVRRANCAESQLARAETHFPALIECSLLVLEGCATELERQVQMAKLAHKSDYSATLKLPTMPALTVSVSDFEAKRDSLAQIENWVDDCIQQSRDELGRRAKKLAWADELKAAQQADELLRIATAQFHMASEIYKNARFTDLLNDEQEMLTIEAARQQADEMYAIAARFAADAQQAAIALLAKVATS